MAWMTTFGIWASMYVGSVVVLMFQVMERPISIAAVLGSGFLAMAIYVLHRRAPEVNDATQQRHHQATSQRRGMLFIFGLSSIVACGMLYAVAPYLLLLLPIGCIAVTLYGRKIVGYPIRNLTLLKPLAVGCSITILAWVVTGNLWPPLAAIGLAIIVTTDALLCDIPDIEYDTACGCTTLPSKTSETTIWLIALAGNLAGAAFLWFVCASITGWLLLIAFPSLYLLRRFDLRFVVDLRLPLIALIAWTL
jgi:4-hydroxybenzoate polyprenyltransferase